MSSSHNEGTCKLCGNHDILKESHFIPKFVGKWLKKTSVTGKMRNSNNMNRPVQDLIKDYWLCDSCEGLLSDCERSFANNAFYPFLNTDQSLVRYDKWLSLFCTSLSWRILSNRRSILEKSKIKEEWITSDIELLFNKAEDNWKKYLLGETDNLNQYEQHLYHTKDATSLDITSSNFINRYLQRTASMDILHKGQNIFVFTKLPSFICLGIIRYNNTTPLRSSRISLNNGVFKSCKPIFPDGLDLYLNAMAQQAKALHSEIPDHQQEKIEKFILDNPDKMRQSKTFEAIQADINLSQTNTFRDN